MTLHWTDRLSEYVDGGLDAGERKECERHLALCPSCSATVAELRRVVARAQGLEDTPPARDLWAGIAGRIGAKVIPLESRRGRRFSFSIPQLAAAGIALVALSAGAAWYATRHARSPVTAVAARPAASDSATTPVWLARNDPHYDNQVAELQRALVEGQGQLDSTTVRVLQKNLAIIDSAIVEARRALAADPANAYLNLHLADTMRRKLQLLRRANVLARART